MKNRNEWVEKGPYGLTPGHIGQVVGLVLKNGATHWGQLEILQEGEGHPRVYKLRGREDWGYSPLAPGGLVEKVFVQGTGDAL